MVPAVLLILLFIGLLIATYRDVQIREVPDTITYALIAIGLLGGLGAALLMQEVSIFLDHLYGFLLGVGVGLVMYYGKQWGGGDAKLLMGVGAILGFSLQNVDLPAFLILLIFCGAAYGLLFTLYLALIKHRAKFLPAFKAYIRTPLAHRLRIGLVFSGIICVAALFFIERNAQLLVGFFLLGLYVLVYSWIFMRVVEKSIMLKEYPVGKLTEGDWIVEDVKVGRKTIITAKNTGITKEQIAQLKKSRVKHVLVKEGIPFVPGFLLAFIALLLLQYFLGAGWLLKMI